MAFRRPCCVKNSIICESGIPRAGRGRLKPVGRLSDGLVSFCQIALPCVNSRPSCRSAPAECIGC
ncbi:hypothetical protein HMPREF9120_01907 [Neisseria sp. oral taxon 020 str. F0370]|nr:hypothetical protein HMPREF9120_01907 [Neisseria sp. oral taxon 020 str. F0370]